MDSLKVISWNIAGARKINSDVQFDYQPEDLDYFAAQIRILDPDVVCLQESLLNADRSIGMELAGLLSFPHVFDTSAGHVAQHIDAAYELGTTIISKHRFTDEKALFYPDPSFELRWKDGSPAAVHHKFLQTVQLQGTTIANTQMLPIHLWGFQYDEGEGAAFAKEIETVLLRLTRPLIFAGSFNLHQPEGIYRRLFNYLGLKDAVPDVMTRHGYKRGANKFDHIYYSPEFELRRSKVVQTQTDHYLCFAEFAKKTKA